jgi:NAD+ synthase
MMYNNIMKNDVLISRISNWLNSYLIDNNLKSYVIGISGGIDSAVSSTLCARTGNKTIVVSMPILQAKDQLERANNHINWLKNNFENVYSYEYDLSNVFNEFVKLFPIENNHASANSRSRLRMLTLYHIASINSGLVVGTGNKVEDFGIGFYTKYGDGGVDISPIADLTKSEVKLLAKDLNINQEILNAKPTDGLWDDGRTDEDQIGASYEELEWIMDYIENDNISVLTERQKEVLNIYNNFHNSNIHKMIPIPIFKK